MIPRIFRVFIDRNSDLIQKKIINNSRRIFYRIS